MCIKAFFFGKSESLAQSFVDSTFKALAALIVGGLLATYIMNSIETSRELARKRAALEAFRNASVNRSLESITNDYSNLVCLRDTGLVTLPTCKSQLSSFSASLRETHALLAALFPEVSFSALVQFKESVDRLHAQPPGAPGDVEKIKAASANFGAAVNEIASRFQ